MCDQPLLEQRQACLRYFPRISMELQERNGVSRDEALQRLSASCLGATDKDERRACLVGVGVYFAPGVFTEPERSAEVCAAFERPDDSVSCILGSLSSAAEYRNAEPLFIYCTFYAEGRLRARCLESAFHFLKVHTIPPEEALRSCHAPGCADAASRVNDDPWTKWEPSAL
jgi:hypothetical protein